MPIINNRARWPNAVLSTANKYSVNSQNEDITKCERWIYMRTAWTRSLQNQHDYKQSTTNVLVVTFSRSTSGEQGLGQTAEATLYPFREVPQGVYMARCRRKTGWRAGRTPHRSLQWARRQSGSGGTRELTNRRQHQTFCIFLAVLRTNCWLCTTLLLANVRNLKNVKLQWINMESGTLWHTNESILKVTHINVNVYIFM